METTELANSVLNAVTLTASSAALNTESVVSMSGLSITGLENGSAILSVPSVMTESLTGQNLIFSADGSKAYIIDSSQLSALLSQTASLNEGTIIQYGANEGIVIENGDSFGSRGENQNNALSSSTIQAVASHQSSSPIKIVPKKSGPKPPEVIQPPHRKGPFKCDACAKEFDKYGQFLKHQKTHLDDKPFRCDKCEASFNIESNLHLHMVTHCTSDPTCPECGKKFSRMASLKSHVMLHEKEENIICPECGDEFNTQNQVEKHMFTHRQERANSSIYMCRYCPQKFTHTNVLKEHMKIHVRMRASLHHRSYKRNIDRSNFGYKCEHCAKEFQKPSQLLRHNRIHTGERPFKCNMCEKAFNQKGALQIHLTKHNGERPFPCDFCPATFSQRGNLRAHIQRVHVLALEPNQPFFRCDACSCVFKKIGNLNAHLSKMHSRDTIIYPEKVDALPTEKASSKEITELPYKTSTTAEKNKENIDLVSQNNLENSDLLQQALENSGLTGNQQEREKIPKDSQEIQKSNFKEVVVTYRLTPSDSASNLDNGNSPSKPRYLVRRVKGVMWHQCVYCTKEFKKPSDLVRHIRIHTHEKPYKCTLCFRAFAVASTLKSHTKVHSGLKEYPCSYCKKFFSTQGSLKVHIRLHTGARPFSCDLCEKTFRTSGHRKSHMLSHDRKVSLQKRMKGSKNSPNKNNSYASLPLQEPILITDEGYLQHTPKTVKQVEEIGGTDRPYRCNMCIRAFKKSSHLKQHIRSHTGEKPFKCTLCYRTFVSNGALKSHINIHLGVKKYKCKECFTSFSTNGSLKRHMATHSDSRPYMCPYCQKTFKTAMDCKKHMKTHRPKILIHGMGNVSLINDSKVQALSDATPVLDSELEMQEELETDNPDSIVPIEQGEEDCNTILPDVAKMDDEIREMELDQARNLQHEEELVTAENLEDQSFEHSQEILPTNLHDFHHRLTQQVFDAQENLNSSELGGPAGMVPFDQSQLLSQTLGQFSVPNLALNQNDVDFTGGDGVNMEAVLPMQEKKSFLETEESSDNSTDKKRKVHKCNICQRAFKKSSHLTQHVRTHTGEKPYHCNWCGRQFNSMGVLKTHMKTHTGVKDYKCRTCSAAFTTNGSLIRHMQVHSTNTPFRCEVCAAEFRTKLLYYKHAKLHKMDTKNEGPTTATVVRKKNTTSILKLSSEQAQQLATVLLPETASVSEKVLVASAAEKDRISEMRDKAAEMENLPKFANQCRACPKSFKKPSDLTRHIRTHTGEKPYPCYICNKSFTVKSTLDCHLKTHTGEKNFFCHVCNSKFATKGSLKVHMRLHTGAKPFKCPHCQLRFRTSGHRKSHISTHFRNSVNRQRSKIPREPVVKIIKDKKTKKQQVPEQPEPMVETINVSSKDDENQLDNQETMLTNITLSTEALNSLLTATGADFGGQGPDRHQLQIPQSLLGQNIQITGIDPALLSQTMQIDEKLLQQLQQHGNINITITPNLVSQPAIVGDKSELPLLQSEVTDGSTLLTVNPNVIIHPLGMTLNDQGQFELNESAADALGIPFHLTVENNKEVDVQPTETAAVVINGLELGKAGLDLDSIGHGITISDNNDLIQNMLNNANSAELNGVGLTLTNNRLAEVITRSGLNASSSSTLSEATSPVSITSSGLNASSTTLSEATSPVSITCSGLNASSSTLSEATSPVSIAPTLINIEPRHSSHVVMFKDSTITLTEDSDNPKSHFLVGKTVFGCKFCEKAFLKRSQLDRHERVHTGEKPFPCSECDKSFSQKNSLEVHFKQHTGEKPFQCVKCPMQFNQKGNMKTHLTRVHKL